MLTAKKSLGNPTELPANPEKLYSKQLQKLESEVREHIQLELQMKLHIETLQETQENTETENEGIQRELQREIQALEEEQHFFKRQLIGISPEKHRNHTPNKPQSELSKYREISQKNNSLRKQLKQSNTQLTDRRLELQGLQRQNNGFKQVLHKRGILVQNSSHSTHAFYKKKYEQKCLECAQTQEKLKKLTRASRTAVLLLKSVSPLPRSNYKKAF